MIIQVISMKGPEDTPGAVQGLLETIKDVVKSDLNIDVIGGSITTMDMFGYCTYLVDIPDDTDGKRVGEYLSRAFFPCNYDILQGHMIDHHCFPWQYAKVNQPTQELYIQ